MPERHAKITWITVSRPGYFGSRRNRILRKYDRLYGKNNYRICWKISDRIIALQDALMLYEDAYYEFLKSNPRLLDSIVTSARDVYDNARTNIKSGLIYENQENHSNHYQDIAVRRVVLRLGRSFQGKKLIQIRHSSASVIGKSLSPGRVPFHLPSLVEKPVKSGWWNAGTVEEFWQSNKVLQVKARILRQKNYRDLKK
jgi:hypothetical protein